MGIKDQATQSMMSFKSCQEKHHCKPKIRGKEIKASVSGQVVDSKVRAKRTVVKAAEKVMDIVPGDELLLIETQIMPNLIDRLQ